MFHWLLVSIFGLILHARTLRTLATHYHVSEKDLTKIGTAIFLLSVGLNFVFREIFSAQIFAQLTLSFLQFVVASIIGESRVRTVRQGILLVIDEIILQMCSGKSFRESLLFSRDRSSSLLRVFLEDLSLGVVFSQHPKTWSKDAFFQEIAREFQLIDKSNAKSLERLRNFRKKIRLQLDFRRRSGQILSQIRTQSLVMSALYLFLLAYVVCTYGFQTHVKLILISSALFLLGCVWVWRAGRRYKWKI